MCDRRHDRPGSPVAPGVALRTVDLIRGQGFEPSGELRSVDSADRSPCDGKAPDSH
ncbi:hypothetical protein ACFQLX_11755 [Streptomyces polyrhachis]|uniref:Uncharacterized protein n=1 Tax=Streptomyces polyrhachis TaxID=1282885 RepID=A0ABW2GFI3_9ACTN